MRLPDCLILLFRLSGGVSNMLAWERRTLNNLPLVSREWKNGSNSSYNCTPFLHSLLAKGK